MHYEKRLYKSCVWKVYRIHWKWDAYLCHSKVVYSFIVQLGLHILKVWQCHLHIIDIKLIFNTSIKKKKRDMIHIWLRSLLVIILLQTKDTVGLSLAGNCDLKRVLRHPWIGEGLLGVVLTSLPEVPFLYDRLETGAVEIHYSSCTSPEHSDL